MGPTGAPTEIPDRRTVLLLGGGLGNAVLFSIAEGDARARQHGDLFRRLQTRRGSVQARRDRGGDQPGDLEHRHRRRDRAEPAAGRALPRQHRPGDARLPARRARLTGRAARVDRSHHRDRIGSHDGGGEGGASRRARAAPQAGSRRHRQHQLADAVHVEGSLRAVSAEARRPGERARRRSSSRASTRTRRWTASIFRTSRRVCVRTPSRKSCPTCGSITCSTSVRCRTSEPALRWTRRAVME